MGENNFKYNPNEIIFKYIPLFSGILIFLGFYDINSFYEKFNIGIYLFISTPEILVSFLPFIMNVVKRTIILLPIFILFYPSIFTLLSSKIKIWSVLVFIIYLIIIQLIFNIFKTEGDFWCYKNKSELLLFSIVSFILIIFLIIKYKREKKCIKKINKPCSLIAIILVIIMIYLTIDTRMQSHSIKDYHPSQYVSFFYLNDTVKTISNDTLVFIGNTRDYLFLKYIPKDSNYIYNLKDIHNLKFVETKY